MIINKWMSLQRFRPLSEAEIQASFIQLKPIFCISLRGFSASCYPQHNLRVLLLLNSMCLLKYVLNCGRAGIAKSV
jgi:hypothetical protein